MPREGAFRKDVADGYIVLKDKNGVRVAADGLGFTNENKIDPSGRFLYVNETMARRLSRFAIGDGAALGRRETVAEFGAGTFPDGFEFDAEGGIWIASVVSNRLLRISADGAQTVVLEDSDPEVVAAVERKYQESGLDPRRHRRRPGAHARQPRERGVRRAGSQDGPSRLAVRPHESLHSAHRSRAPSRPTGATDLVGAPLTFWETAHARP